MQKWALAHQHQLLLRADPTAWQAARPMGRAEAGVGAPTQPAPRVTLSLRAASVGRAEPWRMAGLPATASPTVPVGLRLREEGVDETWGLMDQLPLQPTAPYKVVPHRQLAPRCAG